MANNIKDIRERVGLTQDELAKACDVSQVVISRAESGTKMPSMLLCIQIAKVLGCTLDDLWKVE